MNTINALTAVKSVGTATSDANEKKQFQQKAKPGQKFSATVLESAGKNRIYLDIFGDKILAQSDIINLKPGTKLQLEVLSTKPLLELKIISKTPEMFFGKTLTLLGKNFDIGGLVQILQDSPPVLGQLGSNSQQGIKEFHDLQQIPYGNKDSGDQLKLLLDRIGLSLEPLLAGGNKTEAALSLKAALLELTTLFKSGGELADTTNRILGTLELFQLAQLRLASDDLQIFPLPLPFLDNGYLLVKNNKQRESNDNDEKSTQFSLHLSLEPLGNIEISFLQTQEGLSIQFSCDSLEKMEFTREHQEQLTKMISTATILGVNFTELAGDPTNDLIQQLVGDGQSMLDTKI